MSISNELATALIGLKDVIVADYAKFLKEISLLKKRAFKDAEEQC